MKWFKFLQSSWFKLMNPPFGMIIHNASRWRQLRLLSEVMVVYLPILMVLLLSFSLQVKSVDEIVKNSSYEANSGCFVIPPRTTSVFVEPRATWAASFVRLQLSGKSFKRQIPDYCTCVLIIGKHFEPEMQSPPKAVSGEWIKTTRQVLLQHRINLLAGDLSIYL